MKRRGLALLALVLGMVAACGHYGPPVRAAKAKSDAATTAPAAPEPAPAQDEENRKP